MNYVIEMWNNPCDAPWAVYIETAGPAALQMLVALVCFDFLDAIRYIFRPARLRSGRHMRRGKKGQRGRKAQGIGQRLRSKLPPLKALANRHVAQGAKNLWVIDGIGQRLLWWWLVVDVVTGTLYNWTTAMYKTEFCQMSGGPGAGLRESDNQIYGAVQGWHPASYNIFHYNRGTGVVGPFSFSGGPGSWSIACSLDLHNPAAQDITLEYRIAIQRALGVEYEGYTSTIIPAGGDGGVVTTATIKGDLQGWVEVKVSFGFPTTNSGTIFILAQPDTAQPPIKYNCFGLLDP